MIISGAVKGSYSTRKKNKTETTTSKIITASTTMNNNFHNFSAFDTPHIQMLFGWCVPWAIAFQMYIEIILCFLCFRLLACFCCFIYYIAFSQCIWPNLNPFTDSIGPKFLEFTISRWKIEGKRNGVVVHFSLLLLLILLCFALSCVFCACIRLIIKIFDFTTQKNALDVKRTQ